MDGGYSDSIMFPCDVGSRIKELRKANGMNQIQLADRIKVSRPIMSGYERGMRIPSASVIVKLSEIFNVSTDYILTGRNPPKYAGEIAETCDVLREWYQSGLIDIYDSGKVSFQNEGITQYIMKVKKLWPLVAEGVIDLDDYEAALDKQIVALEGGYVKDGKSELKKQLSKVDFFS